MGNTMTVAEMAATGSVLAMVLMVILLFGNLVYGVLCCKLAHKKGYTGYFWTGFFMGLLGLWYVMGLPLYDDMK